MNEGPSPVVLACAAELCKLGMRAELRPKEKTIVAVYIEGKKCRTKESFWSWIDMMLLTPADFAALTLESLK